MQGALWVLVCYIGAAMRSESGVTPIQKVLSLLDDMLKKSQKGKDEEAAKFAKFSTWCKDQEKTKNGEIADGKLSISKKEAENKKAGTLMQETDVRIKELDADLGRCDTDKKSTRSVRDKEKADYTATLKDYEESLTALDGAIATLKKQDVTRPQAQLLQTSLLQVQSRQVPIPAELRSTLTALAQDSGEHSDSDALSDSVMSSLAESTKALAENMEEPAPAASAEPAGYEFQSGGVS